jgi:dipeptidyl aminopeptidase/acylaminoacyl peptidase
VTKHLINNLSYIDSKKVAIWGWSYGGFLSLSALAQDTDGVFKCAASVALVVDWRLYDTYYTVSYG